MPVATTTRAIAISESVDPSTDVSLAIAPDDPSLN